MGTIKDTDKEYETVLEIITILLWPLTNVPKKGISPVLKLKSLLYKIGQTAGHCIGSAYGEKRSSILATDTKKLKTDFTLWGSYKIPQRKPH